MSFWGAAYGTPKREICQKGAGLATAAVFVGDLLFLLKEHEETAHGDP